MTSELPHRDVSYPPRQAKMLQSQNFSSPDLPAVFRRNAGSWGGSMVLSAQEPASGPSTHPATRRHRRHFQSIAGMRRDLPMSTGFPPWRWPEPVGSLDP